MKALLLLFTLVLFINLNAQVDRSKMPEPGPAPEIKLGEAESFTLSNGLKVFVVENRKIPRISYSLIIHRDPIYEGDAAGYVSAAGELLRGGTKNRTKDQLDNEIDFIGASISTSSTGVYASSLTKHTHKLLELFSDIILNPVFPEDELQKIKTRMKSDLASSLDDPGQIASRVSNALTYGKDHPYGELITTKTIDNITAQKCREYYSTYFRPNTAYLAVVGDLNKNEAEKILSGYLGKWERGDVPKHNYELPQPPEERVAAIVDRPQSVQSVINLTYPVEHKISSPDVIPATVMNTLLGGGVFRLFMNLREKHSYTYGAYSSLQRDEVIGRFSASTDVRNAVTDSAVIQILYEMERLRKEKVEKDELEGVKNYITGTFALSLEDPSTIARFAINVDRYNLPSDYYRAYLKNVEKVTSDDIHKAAQKFLKPENAYIVVVGNRKEIEKGLSSIAAVHLYDVNGESADTAGLSLSDDIDAEKVIGRYIEAIGGREKVSGVKDRTTIMTGTVQGFDVKMTVYQKAPDFLRQEVTASGLEQTIIFNGEAGVMIMGGNLQKITGDELEKLKFEANMELILDPASAGVTMELDGIEKLEDTRAYRIINKSESVTWITYYDVETGLKILENKEVKTPSGVFKQEIWFNDYKEVDGVQYPFSVYQKLGPQEIIFNVTSIKLNQDLKDDLFTID
jgi:zinc protease